MIQPPDDARLRTRSIAIVAFLPSAALSLHLVYVALS